MSKRLPLKLKELDLSKRLKRLVSRLKKKNKRESKPKKHLLPPLLLVKKKRGLRSYKKLQRKRQERQRNLQLNSKDSLKRLLPLNKKELDLKRKPLLRKPKESDSPKRPQLKLRE